jgi:hypothetical protein
VLVLLNICEDVDFVDCALLQFFVLLEATHFDHLYSILFIVVFVYGSIDFTVSTLSYDFVKGVVLDYSYHYTRDIIITELLFFGKFNKIKYFNFATDLWPIFRY